MTSRHEQEQPVDPQLDELLDLIRPTPPMDPEMAARGQAKFMAEIDALFGPLPSSTFSRLTGWISTLYQPKGKFVMATSKQKFIFGTLAVLIAMFVLIFGGASATAYAAQSSLPGDALYPVKTSLEQTQVRLSSNAADQAELQLEFAQRRLQEIAALIDDGRFTNIETATSEFEYHLQQAIDALEFVAVGDPARAEDLAVKIASALSSYASTLNGMMANVPEAVMPAFERAMMASQPAGSVADDEEIEFTGQVEAISTDSWTVAGRTLSISSQTEIEGSIEVGDLVEVHAYETGDGMLAAREIEPVIEDEVAEEHNENDGEMDDDVFGNENENMNGEDNENDADDDDINGNDNDIENLNGDDSNDNEHDDDVVNGDDDNSNDNDNTNDNSNTNDNDNSHENDNANDNDNASNGNDNESSDDNGNDNGDDGGSNDNSGDGDNSNDGGGDDNSNDGGGDGDDDNANS
jgi:hypothetical protein